MRKTGNSPGWQGLDMSSGVPRWPSGTGLEQPQGGHRTRAVPTPCSGTAEEPQILGSVLGTSFQLRPGGAGVCPKLGKGLENP